MMSSAVFARYISSFKSKRIQLSQDIKSENSNKNIDNTVLLHSSFCGRDRTTLEKRLKNIIQPKQIVYFSEGN